MSSKTNDAKRNSAYSAAEYIQSDSVVGLGTGSTIKFLIERIGQKIANGELKNLKCVPSSEQTRKEAEKFNICIIPYDENVEFDIVIDGADEIDLELNLIKGRGAALLREKLIATNTKQFIVIVDESKYCPNEFGIKGVPVEIVQFAAPYVRHKLMSLKTQKPAKAIMRTIDNKLVVTDNGNFIVDLCFSERIKDPASIAQEIKSFVGVVEHGLFLNNGNSICILGKLDGSVKFFK